MNFTARFSLLKPPDLSPFRQDDFNTNADLLDGFLPPPGSVIAFAGAAGTPEWLLCDGAAVSRAIYARLFAVIGTVYGVGDGATTFNLPDLRGRVAAGKGTHADVSALGNNEGVAAAFRRLIHRHTPHSHSNADGNFVTAADTSRRSSPGAGNVVGDNFRATTTSVDGGSGNPNDSLDAPAYLVLNYLIKT